MQFEASRLVMIQILLHGLKMDPLVSLHYYAPVCALINLLVLPFTEGLARLLQLARIVLSSSFPTTCLAFLLNIAAVFPLAQDQGLCSPSQASSKCVDVSAARRCMADNLIRSPGHPAYHWARSSFRVTNYTDADIWLRSKFLLFYFECFEFDDPHHSQFR